MSAGYEILGELGRGGIWQYLTHAKEALAYWERAGIGESQTERLAFVDALICGGYLKEARDQLKALQPRSSKLRLRVRLARAECSLLEGRPKDAEELLKNVKDPDTRSEVELLTLRARCRLALGDRKGATETLQKTGELDKGSRKPWRSVDVAAALIKGGDLRKRLADELGRTE